MILNETVAAIADAIREKTGKSELIKPIDFASEMGLPQEVERAEARVIFTMTKREPL